MCFSFCNVVNSIQCANHKSSSSHYPFMSFSLQDFHKDVPRTVPAKHTTVVADTVKLVASRKDSAT